jgi:hypothetical protein
MTLYKKLNLPDSLIEEIKNCALAEMQDMQFGAMQLYFLKRPQYILGRYLKENYPDLPSLYNCILFRRHGGYQQPIHLDCNNDDPPQGIKCAINIPLLNCDNSYMEWYTGDYEISVASVKGRDGIVRKHLELIWSDDDDDDFKPDILDRVIIDTPTLVTVNQPHAVTVTDRTRCLITFRFATNPDFEQVANILG